MNKQKLTTEQIESLYDFCRKHYVQHYDLQVELVDHLATEIEEIWITEPNISFQLALEKSFGKFGIYGFSKIKTAKQKGLQRQYRKIIWENVKEFYRLPKIILTAGLTFLIFELFRLIPNQSLIIYVYTGFLAVFTLFYIYYIFPKYYKIKVDANKKFLIVDTLNAIQGTLGMMPIFLFQLSNLLREFHLHQFSWWILLLISTFISGFSIVMYTYFFYIPKTIQKDFYNQFPQFAKI